MAKPEWGTKRLCPSCGIRFYDMKKSPVTCPGCDADVPVEPLLKARKPAAVKEAPAPAKPEEKKDVETSEDVVDEVADIEDVEDIDDDDDDDDALIEDASDLAEEDDVSEVKEHMEEAPDADL